MFQEGKLPESKMYLSRLSQQGKAYKFAATQVSRNLQCRLLEQLQPSHKSTLEGMAGTCSVPCWCNMLWWPDLHRRPQLRYRLGSRYHWLEEST
jgi:hypothetical protein